MARPDIPNIWEIVCSGVAPGGETWLNVFHADTSILDGDFSDSTNRETARGLLSALYQAEQANKVDEWQFNLITFREYEGDFSAAYETAGVFANGTSNTDPLPNQVALVLSWRSRFSNRRARGRSFFNGWVEAANGAPSSSGASGAPLDALCENMADAAETFRLGMAAADMPLVILSLTSVPPISTPVETVLISRKWGTQRRRQKDTPAGYIAPT